jgi:farnesyl-diphosphate farnesyltransferase
MSDTAALKFCTDILPTVSRTFAINIRVLKGELYRAVLIAYLFCRIVDTVEDEENLTIDLRNRLLDDYMAFFKTSRVDTESLAQWVSLFGRLDPSKSQELLIRDSHLVFEVYEELPPSTRTIISECVLEMATGMKKTVNRRNSQESLHALQTMKELEEYCYYVAGTVGVMLTRLFAIYSKSLRPGVIEKMSELQSSFALGLQLTNIIKDCSEDFRRGWCYVPSNLAGEFGVPITEFLDSKYSQRSLDVLNSLSSLTAKHLDKALEYTLLLPRTEIRMRLFNLWSLFFAVRTLGKAWNNRDLLGTRVKVKISRFEVYMTLLETTLGVSSITLLRRLYHRFRKKIPN